MTELKDDLINTLRHDARIMVRELGLLNSTYFDIDVTLAERHLITELNDYGVLTMGELSSRLVLDKSTISRLVAKAIKKNYVQTSIDSRDRRRKFLQLTTHGKHVFNTFEPIAFKHTKSALIDLSIEEIHAIHKGISLYAQGLRKARFLQTNNLTGSENVNNDNMTLSDIYTELLYLGYKLRTYEVGDEPILYKIFQETVGSGSNFPYNEGSIEEFRHEFLQQSAKVYVCYSITKGTIIGGFVIKNNFAGRSKHIANAIYMLNEQYTNQGIGTCIIKASLHLAKQHGFKAMQFNMVLNSNHTAIRIYKKLNFKIIGTIPEAICNSDGSYQDGYIMYKKLDNI